MPVSGAWRNKILISVFQINLIQTLHSIKIAGTKEDQKIFPGTLWNRGFILCEVKECFIDGKKRLFKRIIGLCFQAISYGDETFS